MTVTIDKQSRAKEKVIYPIEAGRFSLPLPNIPMRLIEQTIEHAERAMFSSKSVTYPTSPPAISNTKKKNEYRTGKPVLYARAICPYHMNVKL